MFSLKPKDFTKSKLIKKDILQKLKVKILKR